MAVDIKLKRSHTHSNIPTTSDLSEGEFAINTYDGKMYMRDGSSNIVTVGSHYTTDFESTTKTFYVTVATSTSDHVHHGNGSSNKYKINGVFSPYLKLIPGITYRFDQSDSSNSGHPFRFYLDENKNTSYTTGVTTNGTAGSSGAYTEIVVTHSTPPVLHYQCSAHGLMGWAAFVNTSNLTAFDTGDLTEGSNLYYTDARVGTYISGNRTYGNITSTGDISGAGSLTLTSTDTGSSAAPIIDLVRDSSSPADADYLGQLAFKGDDDGGSSHTYAKISGKIDDASAGSEDGLLEFAVVSGGSNEIVARIKNNGLFINTGNTIRFEGATADAHETTLTVTDPTADRTITFPNSSGTVALTSDITSSDVVDDTSPQLGGYLDTNSFNIKFDDAHGIYDDSNNEMLVFEKTASADSYIEVHNAITNSTSATLFGNDVVGSNTGSAPTSVGPGFAATGTNDNVALAFKTKGLGKFIFLNDDTTDSIGPTLNLMRKHSSEADNDNIGQILFQGMDSSPAGSDVEDLRDYAKVRARMIDVTDGTVDGQLRLSALVNNSHKTLVEIGVHEDDDNAAGVSLWRGQMRDIGSNTTLDEGDYAGRYLRVTGAYTVTLPASPAKGEQYIIISDHAGTTTISANGSDTMNGSTSNQTITTRYQAKTCIAVSTSAWIVLG